LILSDWIERFTVTGMSISLGIAYIKNELMLNFRFYLARRGLKENIAMLIAISADLIWGTDEKVISTIVPRYL